MSFDLTLPPILGVVGLVIAFAIYTVMSRAPAGEGKIQGIAEQIHIGAMVFMHREYKLLLAFAAVLVVGILASPLGTDTAIAFIAGAVSSATAGYLGMYAATKANVRTAAAPSWRCFRGLVAASIPSQLTLARIWLAKLRQASRRMTPETLA
jgi:K(+)-stimulated pyrophosphate-energized sodium pump